MFKKHKFQRKEFINMTFSECNGDFRMEDEEPVS